MYTKHMPDAYLSVGTAILSKIYKRVLKSL